MALVGKNRLAKKFGGRRVGQAVENNALYTNGMVRGDVEVTNSNEEVTRRLANFDAYQLDETQPLDALERESNVDIDIAVESNGDRVIVLTDEFSGAQVVSTMPAQQQQAPQEDEACEFPAQSVQLVRDVIITNTAPQVVDVQTDICGNVVSYTESMTRNMNATQWRAVNAAQLEGPIRQFSVNDQGTIINGSGNVRLANSPGLNGFSAPQQVTSQQRVGARKIHQSNQNAAFGAAKMAKWRSS